MRWLLLLARLPSTLLLGVVSAMALAFSPWKLGRMLQTVSLPRMREHRLRTSFTVLGVALGVAVLVAVIMVSRSIVSSVTHTVGDLAGKAELQVAGDSTGFDEAVLDKLRDVPGIHKLTPVVQQTATLRPKGGGRERMLILGVDLLGTEDQYFRSYDSKELDEIRREPLAFLNSPHNIILGRELAERVGARLHDKVAISTSSGVQSFEVWGFIESEGGVGGAFGGAVGVMYYPAMQVAFGRNRNIDRIEIAVTPGRNLEQVARQLRAVLGESFLVEPPGSRGDRVAQMLLAVRTALYMSSLLALIAGGFLVVNTMGISVVQRKRELGILRALGTTRRQLVALLTLEGALLGTVGSALGVGLALLIARAALSMSSDAVNEVYLEQAAGDVQLDPTVLLLGFAVGIVAATLASWIATNKAGSIKPTEALSASTLSVLSPVRPSRRTDLLGAGLVLSAGLLLLLPPVGNMPYGAILASLSLTFGGRVLMPRVVGLVHALVSALRGRFLSVETVIANDNLPRDLQRTSSMASGLMAGVTLTVGIGTFIVSFITSLNTWSDQLLPGDLMVTSGSVTVGLSGRNTPMDDSVREKLEALEGVRLVRSFLFTDVDFRGLPIKMGVGDRPELSRFTPLEGTEQDVYAGLERGEVVLGENLSRRFDLHRGDVIALSTKDGTRDFKVAAVVIDYTSDRGIMRVHRKTHVAYWGEERVDSYELFLEPGVDPERVRATINAQLAEQHDLFVLTTREFRGEFVKAADKIFSLLHVLEVVTLMVAMLGMVTAVLANVLDRVREVGVLRALGMLRGQVRKMVVVEATLIGGVGALGGILVGLGVGYILLRHIAGFQMGWHLPYQLPLASILTMLAVTLPVSALAGFFPARKAAGLVVSEALDYE
ncbi:MAG: transporter permease protein [Myxococcaceae bacterium]|nr:transporter permease protein [Myxococcaceae bacterium]